MARGLLVYPMGGTVDGVEGDHVLLAPPFVIEPSGVDAIVERLGVSLEAAFPAAGEPRQRLAPATERAQWPG